MSSLQLPLPIWPVNNCKRSTSTVVTLLRWSMYAITGCPWLSTIKSVILSKDHPTPWLPAPGSSATFGVVSQKYAKVNTVATLRHILPLVTECFPSQAAHPTVISPASQQQPRGSSPQLQPSTFMSDLDVTLCSMLLILQLPLSSSFVQAYSFAIPEGTMDALQCFWSFAQEPSNRLQTACTHSFTSQLAAVVVKQTMKQMRRPHADLNSAALYLEVLLQLMLACPTKQSAVESMAKHGKQTGVTGSVHSSSHALACSEHTAVVDVCPQGMIPTCLPTKGGAPAVCIHVVNVQISIIIIKQFPAKITFKLGMYRLNQSPLCKPIRNQIEPATCDVQFNQITAA